MAISRNQFNGDYNDYGSHMERERYEREMIKKHEYEMRKMMALQEAQRVPSPPQEPQKPKHMNPKLLILKGA